MLVVAGIPPRSRKGDEKEEGLVGVVVDASCGKNEGAKKQHGEDDEK